MNRFVVAFSVVAAFLLGLTVHDIYELLGSPPASPVVSAEVSTPPPIAAPPSAQPTNAGAPSARPSAPEVPGVPTPQEDSAQIPTAGAPARAPNAALVTMVLFSDFQCPPCAEVDGTLRQLRERYGEQLRVVWRNNPLAMHDNAMIAAEAAMEAFAQGGAEKFWRMHDTLYQHRDALARPALDNHTHQASIRDDMAAARATGGRPRDAVALHRRSLRRGRAALRRVPPTHRRGARCALKPLQRRRRAGYNSGSDLQRTDFSPMTDSSYVPPKVWTPNAQSGGRFASINRPVAGPTHEKALPIGRHPLQLYSLGTPNGVKVTVMLEELLALGHRGAEYDAWLINIGEGEQFGSGFVEVNPNSKIPALVDRSTEPSTPVFESGAILLYLAEKFGALLPTDHQKRTACLSWLFWQMGSAPYLGGGFGHFYAYAPVKIEYAIDRFAMEIKRQLDVLDRHLADHRYMAGDEYTIADIAIWPWYGALVAGLVYDAAEFLQTTSYTHVNRWANELAERPAVKRGRMVNRVFGKPESQLRERHDASDFDTRTQDKLETAAAGGAPT